VNQIPIPAELVPPGIPPDALSPTGASYADAIPIPVQVADPHNGEGAATVAVTRWNHLFQASREEVQQLARNGWLLWVRHAAIGGTAGTLLSLEPVVPILNPNLPLNSDLQP
jgi:hypothetical protein